MSIDTAYHDEMDRQYAELDAERGKRVERDRAMREEEAPPERDGALDELAQAREGLLAEADAGQPLRIAVREELPEANQRLMDLLGVEVDVDPKAPASLRTPRGERDGACARRREA